MDGKGEEGHGGRLVAHQWLNPDWSFRERGIENIQTFTIV